MDTLFKGRDALAQKDWTSGQVILSKLLTKIEAEPRLADLPPRAADTLDQFNRGLADQQAWEADAPGIASSSSGGMKPSFMKRVSRAWITRQPGGDPQIRPGRAGNVRRARGRGSAMDTTTFAPLASTTRAGGSDGGLRAVTLGASWPRQCRRPIRA